MQKVYRNQVYFGESLEDSVPTNASCISIDSHQNEDNCYYKNIHFECGEPKEIRSTFRMIGFTAGFLAQLLCLASVLWMEFWWATPFEPSSRADLIFHYFLGLLSLMSLLVWFLLWMSPFILTTTLALRLTCISLRSPHSQDYLFLNGMHFFIGMCLGSFSSMLVVNALLGFPVNLLKLLGGLIVCLGVITMMIYGNDLDHDQLNQDKKDELSESLIYHDVTSDI